MTVRPEAVSAAHDRTAQPERTGSSRRGSIRPSVGTSPGRPLDLGIREMMETRFAHDFSGVRIHDDTAASRAAHDLNARAFAHGQDVYFGASQFQPTTADGQHLLAHELTHTVQVRGTSAATGPLLAPETPLSRPADPLELEASATASRLAESDKPATSPLPISTAPAGGGIYRQGADPGLEAPADETSGTSEAGAVRTPADLAAWVAEQLRTDPDDRSGTVRRRLAGLAPTVREAMLEQARASLPPAQRAALAAVTPPAMERAGERPRNGAPTSDPEATADDTFAVSGGPRTTAEESQQESAQDGASANAREADAQVSLAAPAPAAMPAGGSPAARPTPSLSAVVRATPTPTPVGGSGTTAQPAASDAEVDMRVADVTDAAANVVEAGAANDAEQGDQEADQAVAADEAESQEAPPSVADRLEPVRQPSGADQTAVGQSEPADQPDATPTDQPASPSTVRLARTTPLDAAPVQTDVPSDEDAPLDVDAASELDPVPTAGADAIGPERATTEPAAAPAADSGQAADPAAGLGADNGYDPERARAEVREIAEALAARPAEASRQIDAQVAASTATLTKRASSLRSSIHRQVAQNVSAIRSGFATKRVGLGKSLEAAHTQIDVQLALRLWEATTEGTLGANRLRDVFSNHRYRVNTEVIEAVAWSEKMRSRYILSLRSRVREQSDLATRRGEIKANSYPADARGQVQRRAARGVANRLATEVDSNEPKASQAFLEVTQSVPDEFRRLGSETLRGFDANLPDLLAGAQAHVAEVQMMLRGQAEQAHQQLAAMGTRALAQLNAAETAAVAHAEAVGPRSSAQIDGAIAIGRRRLRAASPSASSQIGAIVDEAVQILLNTETPDVEAAGEMADQISEFVNGAASDAVSAVEQAGAGMGDELDKGLPAVRSGLASISQAAAKQRDDHVTKSNGAIAGFVTGVDTALGQSIELLKQSFTDTENAIQEKLDPAVAQLVSGFGKVKGDAEASVLKIINDAVAKNNEALSGQEQAMRRAVADAVWHFDHPVLAGIGDVIDFVAGAIAAILVVAALVVAVILVAKLAVAGLVALGISAAVAEVIVGVVMVGLLVYGIYQAYDARIQQGAQHGWGTLGLALVDLTGLTDIGRAFTDPDMTPFDRGYSFGKGIATIASFFVIRGLGKAINGRLPSAIRNPVRGSGIRWLRGRLGGSGGQRVPIQVTSTAPAPVRPTTVPAEPAPLRPASEPLPPRPGAPTTEPLPTRPASPTPDPLPSRAATPTEPLPARQGQPRAIEPGNAEPGVNLRARPANDVTPPRAMEPGTTDPALGPRSRPANDNAVRPSQRAPRGGRPPARRTRTPQPNREPMPEQQVADTFVVEGNTVRVAPGQPPAVTPQTPGQVVTGQGRLNIVNAAEGGGRGGPLRPGSGPRGSVETPSARATGGRGSHGGGGGRGRTPGEADGRTTEPPRSGPRLRSVEGEQAAGEAGRAGGNRATRRGRPANESASRGGQRGRRGGEQTRSNRRSRRIESDGEEPKGGKGSRGGPELPKERDPFDEFIPDRPPSVRDVTRELTEIEALEALGETARHGRRVTDSTDRTLPARVGTAVEKPTIREITPRLRAEGFRVIPRGRFSRPGRFQWLRKVFPGNSRPDLVGVKATGRKTLLIGDVEAQARASHIEKTIGYAKKLIASPDVPPEFKGYRVVVREWFWEHGARKLKEIIVGEIP